MTLKIEHEILLKKSLSHLAVNDQTYEEIKDVDSKIGNMRALINAQRNTLIFPYTETGTENHVNYCFDVIKKMEVGNCAEYSLVGLKLLREHYPHIGGEVMSLSNGGHEFLVIGRDPNSTPNDWRSWGENAVVVDSWSCQVFRSKDIPKYLQYHKFYFDINKRICGPFHSENHCIEQRFYLPPKVITSAPVLWHPQVSPKVTLCEEKTLGLVVSH